MSVGQDDDPTDFEGIYPGILPAVTSSKTKKAPKDNASTATSAAGIRAITAQAIAFYFRAPAKAFFRQRLDYLAYARTLQAQNSAIRTDSTSRRLSWLRSTTPGVIASAISASGWRVIPDQILPPFLANLTVGAVLYTSYLQVLSQLHEESSKSTKRVFPPPSPQETFTAGFVAGSIQSIVASPLDAVQIRYERQDSRLQKGGLPQSMWTFGREKLKEIGARGIFAGYGLSLVKDSCGSAIFFSTFEYIKAQGYYRFVRWYYGSLHENTVQELASKRPVHAHSHSARSVFPSTMHFDDRRVTTIKPHFAIEPTFLFLAGISASVAQSAVIYPLHHIQVEHWNHLEELDEASRRIRRKPRTESQRRWRMIRQYYRAYQATWEACRQAARSETRGNLMAWLYRGFTWNTMRQLPSTSAGLIIFELVRRRYGSDSDQVHLSSKQGEYTILLQ